MSSTTVEAAERLTKIRILGNKRKEFLVNFLVTLSCIATLLVLTFVGLDAQDAAGQLSKKPPLAQDQQADNLTQLAATGGRETRSTTRRRPGSTTSTTTTSSTTTTTMAPQSSGTEPAGSQMVESGLAQTTATNTSADLGGGSSRKTGRSSTKPTSTERTLTEAEYDEEMARLERERKRRLKQQRRKKEGSQKPQQTTPAASSTTTPTTSTTDDYDYELDYDYDSHNGRSLGPFKRPSLKGQSANSSKPAPSRTVASKPPPNSTVAPANSTLAPTSRAPAAPVTPSSMIVQVVNQTELANSSSSASNSTGGKQLDWSKLVKVVFKSERDNHTLYTLVMNSSELSQHPISDWSHELPALLQRDFEKLVQKWSSVFPMENIMTDLSSILANKLPFNITSRSAGSNSSATSVAPATFNATTVPSTPPIDVTAAPAISTFSTLSTLGVVASASSRHPTILNSTGALLANETTTTTTTMSPVVNVTLPTATSFRVSNFTEAPKVIAPADRPQMKSPSKVDKAISEIEDEVKGSLRHFIIICSIAVVVATSIMVALIVLLFK